MIELQKMANFFRKANLHGCLEEGIQWMKVSQLSVTSDQANKAEFYQCYLCRTHM